MPTADLGDVVSSFAPANVLYNAASGKDLIASQNALMAQVQNRQIYPLQVQEAQQKIGSGETEMMARAAGALLAEPDLAKRTALYPQFVSGLQAQGFAKLAPSVMPDESHLRALFALGTSPQDQLQYGAIQMPGMAGAPPLPGQPGYGQPRYGAAQPGGGGAGGTARGAVNPYVGANLPSGVTPDEDQLVRTVYGEAGNQPVAGQQAVAHVIKTRMKIAGQGVQDTVFAPNQFEAWVDPKNRPRMESLDPNSPEYQRILSTVVRPVMTGQAQDPTGGATNFVNPTLQAQLGRAQPGWAQGNRTRIGDHDFYYGGYGPQPTAQQAAAAPGAAPGAAAPPAPYRVAGAVVAPPGAQPAPVVAPTSGDNTPVNGMRAPPQAQQQAQAQPPSAQQPAPQAQPPTGTSSQQFQAAQQLLNQAAQYEAFAKMPGPLGARYAAEAARLKAQAALYMQADSVSYDPVSGIGTKAITGERLNAAAPNANYQWDAKQGAYVDLSGTHPPVTPPSPRLTSTPGGDIIQSKPGGGANVVYTTDPARLSAQEAAKAEGAASGTAAAKALPEMINQARTAGQAEGNIDYGLSQLDRARSGGINTGYFSGALATAAAAAKSLGIPPQYIGIDPSAIGNIQTAQKTLAVVSGAILQQIIGKGAITDDKVEAFIHAQPGIETDPDAVRRVLAWARSQFTYEREMGQAAVREASKPENAGRLPTGWQAGYYDQHGFAPIYSPASGEMQQPDGGAPGRSSPTAPEPTTAAPRIIQYDANGKRIGG